MGFHRARLETGSGAIPRKGRHPFPLSIMAPSFTTKIWSARWMVARRWAMTTDVLPVISRSSASNGKFHGSDLDLRARLEPMFVKHGVNVKPQQVIYYFVLGSSGELRPHNLNPSPDTARGFDTDQTFGLIEIAGDQFNFQIVSRTGATVDSGAFPTQKQAK
jgi:hypothetical protein